MKIICDCCGEEVKPKDRLSMIQDIMMEMDRRMTSDGLTDEEIGQVVHTVIALSDMSDGEGVH